MAIICIVGMALEWYMSDEAFEHPILANSKDLYTLCSVMFRILIAFGGLTWALDSASGKAPFFVS